MTTRRRTRPGAHSRPRALVLIAALLAQVPATAASLEASVTDADGLALEHAVVSLHGELPVKAPPGTHAIMDQRERRFAPTVVPIQTGTDVSFPNGDDVRHHVYSFSEPKTFQLKLYHGEASEPVHFGEPGIVVLGCNIHDSMLGYLAVLDTPLFTKSAASGKAVIESAPGGRYTLQVWHPDLGIRHLSREIVLGEGVARIDVSLDADALSGAEGPAIAAARPKEISPLQSLFDD